jgi:hypothetical protein
MLKTKFFFFKLYMFLMQFWNTAIIRIWNGRRKRSSRTKIRLVANLNFNKFIYPSSRLNWGDLAHNCIRGIMNVRFFKNARRVLFHQIQVLAESYKAIHPRNQQVHEWEENGINIFFRIRAAIKFLRFTFLKMFNKMTANIRQANTFLHPLRKFSAYQFIWFVEFNLAILLIKLKFSTSLYFSKWLIGNSFIFLSNHSIPYFYSLITPNSYLQFIISFKIFFFLKKFFQKFFSLLRFFSKYVWALNKARRMQFFDNRRKKIFQRFLYFGVYQLYFIRLFEIDYITLTFIFLPPVNEIIIINYVHFVWANHWNHKVVTWKYLT